MNEDIRIVQRSFFVQIYNLTYVYIKDMSVELFKVFFFLIFF